MPPKTNLNILCTVTDISKPQLLPVPWGRSDDGSVAKNVSIYLYFIVKLTLVCIFCFKYY